MRKIIFKKCVLVISRKQKEHVKQNNAYLRRKKYFKKKVRRTLEIEMTKDWGLCPRITRILLDGHVTKWYVHALVVHALDEKSPVFRTTFTRQAHTHTHTHTHTTKNFTWRRFENSQKKEQGILRIGKENELNFWSNKKCGMNESVPNFVLPDPNRKKSSRKFTVFRTQKINLKIKKEIEPVSRLLLSKRNDGV